MSRDRETATRLRVGVMSAELPGLSALSINELKTVIERGGLRHNDCLDRADLEHRAAFAVARTSAMLASLDVTRLQAASEVFKTVRRAADRARDSGGEWDVRAALEEAYACGADLLPRSERISLIAQLGKIQWANAGFVTGAGPTELGLPSGGVIAGPGNDQVFELLDAREIYLRAREAARARSPSAWLDEPDVRAACERVEASQTKLGLTRETMGTVEDQVNGADKYGNRLWHSRLGRKLPNSKY